MSGALGNSRPNAGNDGRKLREGMMKKAKGRKGMGKGGLVLR